MRIGFYNSKAHILTVVSRDQSWILTCITGVSYGYVKRHPAGDLASTTIAANLARCAGCCAALDAGRAARPEARTGTGTSLRNNRFRSRPKGDSGRKGGLLVRKSEVAYEYSSTFEDNLSVVTAQGPGKCPNARSSG